MSGKAFVDTNVFVYLYSSKEPNKRDMCIDALDKYICVTSTQSLNELSNVFIKKYNCSAEKIEAHLDNIDKICEVRTINRKTINMALKINDRYGFSYYDSLMIASAIESDCDVLLTEDMNDGQKIESKLKIINPFKN